MPLHPHTALRRRLAGAALTLLLTAGAHAAQAAEPAAPDRLAAQAAGVVGSGDQLSLRIRAPEGERIVKVGEVYADGWTLRSLSPTKATLAKGGETREVGLNPTGALAGNAAVGPPSTVTVVGLPSEAMIQAYIDKNPAMFAQLTAQAGRLGLTTPEMRRYFAEIMAMQEMGQSRQAAGEAFTMDFATLRSVLGDEAANDYIAIRSKGNLSTTAQMVAELRAQPFTGPSSYYVPAGANPAQVASAQGIDARGQWITSAPDAQGGITRTRQFATANEAADAYAASFAQSQAVNPSGIPGAEIQRPAP